MFPELCQNFSLFHFHFLDIILFLNHDTYKEGAEADAAFSAWNDSGSVTAKFVSKFIKSGEGTAESAVVTESIAESSEVSFIVSSDGTVYPVPEGAVEPSPVINSAGKQTGVAFTGGSGGINGQVNTIKIMNPTPPVGKSAGYPNGYIKFHIQNLRELIHIQEKHNLTHKHIFKSGENEYK